MAALGAGCDEQGPVDWNFLLSELLLAVTRGQSPGEDGMISMGRWMSICTLSTTVAVVTPWELGYCWIGGLAAHLLSVVCKGSATLARLLSWLPTSVSAKTEADTWRQILASDWPVFELVDRLRVHLSERDEAQAVLPVGALPPRCGEGLAGGVVGLADEVAAAERGFPVAWASVRQAALLVGDGRSDEVRTLMHAAIESCLECLNSSVPLLRVLLASKWPLAVLLGRLHGAIRAKGIVEKIAISQPGVFERMPNWTILGSSLAVAQLRDPAYPWVQVIAKAAPPEQLYLELPWPTAAPPFADMKEETRRLLRSLPTEEFVSSANFRGSWRAVCLVCRNGSQDPQLSSDDPPDVFRKTPLLRQLPLLERFIDLFGPTLRVRLSIVLAGGGMIGWHTDANVEESGRLILHIPLFTAPATLNRLGNILFQMPEGRIIWADYSFPHTVYNGDPRANRVHLLIEPLLAGGNDLFQRHFLNAMPAAGRRFLSEVAAVPDALSPTAMDADELASAAARRLRTRVARSAAMLMTRGFDDLYGESLLRLENDEWRRLVNELLQPKR
eukprot:TRINITY_DN50528_c0_g1_i1.p1 TRINITY_DN50528_c0_g1~~TRINITY_DN50528_c0_g1_i1.p1  ORF type:complete len:558 (+),score=82.15 TRINITY_DN50528_c0_g1_i1:64-1737(+)